MSEEFNFCPRCAAALERNQEPLKWAWNLPGGFVEPDESGPQAIKREVREETGLKIAGLALIGIFRGERQALAALRSDAAGG